MTLKITDPSPRSSPTSPTDPSNPVDKKIKEAVERKKTPGITPEITFIPVKDKELPRIQVGEKTYVLSKITRKVGKEGKVVELDLKKLSQADLSKLEETAKKTQELLAKAQETPDDFKHSKSFSLNFSTTIQKKKAESRLDKITYRPSHSKTDKSFIIDPSTYAENDQPEILKSLDLIHRTFREIITKHIPQASAHRLKPTSSPKPSPTPKKEDLGEYIHDAGATGNKCAALSIAQNELAAIENSNYQPIIDKYHLELSADVLKNADTDKRKQLLSDALIEKAAKAIETNKEFLRTDEKLPMTVPNFGAIICALKEKDRERQFKADLNQTEQTQICKEYTQLIREKGQHLDLPFFVALGLPLMIIHKEGSNHGIRGTSPGLKLDNLDLKKLNIVYYDGRNHYQSVIIPEGKEAVISDLLTADKNKLLKSFENTIKTEVTLDSPNTQHEKNKFQDQLEFLLTRYPSSQDEIINILVDKVVQDRQKEYRNSLESLKQSALFASLAVDGLFAPISADLLVVD